VKDKILEIIGKIGAFIYIAFFIGSCIFFLDAVLDELIPFLAYLYDYKK
jgi:hypothetical protein